MSAPARHVYEDLARRLRRTTREEIGNSGTSLLRFTVAQTNPLVIEQVEGDLVLEDGDPDFVVGDWVRQMLAQYGLAEGDQVWVVKERDQYHAVDSASSAQPAPAVSRPAVPPVVAGSRGGNSALASLLAALVQAGLITDNTTP